MSIAEIADPTSELVRQGLERHCSICKARNGLECVNTIRPGEPLPGRCIHFERALKPALDNEPVEKDGS